MDAASITTGLPEAHPTRPADDLAQTGQSRWDCSRTSSLAATAANHTVRLTPHSDRGDTTGVPTPPGGESEGASVDEEIAHAREAAA
jgi:hypothetical protein